MSHFSEVTRPTMRRKSSAQNLLSSFKSTTPQSTTPTPAVPTPSIIGTSAGTIPSVNGMSLGLASVAAHMTTNSVMRGDSGDAQSAYTDINYSGNANPMAGVSSPPLGSSTSVESLRELVQKRLVTLTYVRNAHEGRSYWFHTLLITRGELEKVFNNHDMKKRTARFATLGLSLSTLLDINNPQDLLRTLLNIVTEYDQAKEDGDKPKMRIFKKNAKRLAGGGSADYSSTESADASCLMTPSMPFQLDYHETVLSLLDVVSEVYNKLSKVLGPSSLPHSYHSLGPIASITPYPGVSYLFASEANNHSHQYPSTGVNNVSSQQFPKSSSNPNLQFPGVGGSSSTLPGSWNSGDYDAGNSLWSIANASSMGTGLGPGGFSGPTNNWSLVQSEMILKIDSKLKKITNALLKDLDTFARNGIRDEIASLDPLLRNLAVSEERTYDFEG